MRIFGPSRIAIIGAGEFGKQAAHYILQNDRNSRHHEIVGWYDDTISKGEIIAGYPVLILLQTILILANLNIFSSL